MFLIDRRAAARATIVAAILFLSISASGCMAFRGGELDETRPWPPPPTPGTKKPSVGLFVQGKHLLNRDQTPTSAVFLDRWAAAAEEVYVDSGLFSDVLRARDGTEVRAEVEVVESEY